MQNNDSKQNDNAELVAIVLGAVEYGKEYFYDKKYSLCSSIRVDIGAKPYGNSFYGAQEETYFIGLMKSHDSVGYIVEGELKPSDPIKPYGTQYMNAPKYVLAPDWADICDKLGPQELPDVVKKLFKDNIKGRVDKSGELTDDKSKKLTLDEMKELINTLEKYKKDR